jgi:hypothetical protein
VDGNVVNQIKLCHMRQYNKFGLNREMLTYKPFTNSAVQEELIKYLPNKAK